MASSTLPVYITSNFDSGNAEVVKVEQPAQGGCVKATLKIKKEPFTEGTDNRQHSQW